MTLLQPDEVAYVDRCLPLSRLDQQLAEGSTYLVAWDDDQPVGHAHIAWLGTHLGLLEIQDVYVVPEQRCRGIAAQLTHAAEQEARSRARNASVSASAKKRISQHAGCTQSSVTQTQESILCACPGRSSCVGARSRWMTLSCISPSLSEAHTAARPSVRSPDARVLEAHESVSRTVSPNSQFQPHPADATSP